MWQRNWSTQEHITSPLRRLPRPKRTRGREGTSSLKGVFYCILIIPFLKGFTPRIRLPERPLFLMERKICLLCINLILWKKDFFLRIVLFVGQNHEDILKKSFVFPSDLTKLKPFAILNHRSKHFCWMFLKYVEPRYLRLNELSNPNKHHSHRWRKDSERMIKLLLDKLKRLEGIRLDFLCMHYIPGLYASCLHIISLTSRKGPV